MVRVHCFSGSTSDYDTMEQAKDSVLNDWPNAAFTDEYGEVAARSYVGDFNRVMRVARLETMHERPKLHVVK